MSLVGESANDGSAAKASNVIGYAANVMVASIATPDTHIEHGCVEAEYVVHVEAPSNDSGSLKVHVSNTTYEVNVSSSGSFANTYINPDLRDGECLVAPKHVEPVVASSHKHVVYTESVVNSMDPNQVHVVGTMNGNVVSMANVVIPVEVGDDMCVKFANTLYGYFIGQRLAFPIVEDYVKHAWAKFGFEHVIL